MGNGLATDPHRRTQTMFPGGRWVARGEMSELAEGARLEIVCTTKSGTEGSNPSLSAIFHSVTLIDKDQLGSIQRSAVSLQLGKVKM